VLEFIGAVDVAMVEMRAKNAGKVKEVSTFIRDVFAWRKTPAADKLVDNLAAAVVGMSVSDISGERGSGPGPAAGAFRGGTPAAP
jgi:hypothetical protein